MSDNIRIEVYPAHPDGGMQCGVGGPGVKATHTPTGVSATSVSSRIQYVNKRLAVEKLMRALEKLI